MLQIYQQMAGAQDESYEASTTHDSAHANGNGHQADEPRTHYLEVRSFAKCICLSYQMSHKSMSVLTPCKPQCA